MDVSSTEPEAAAAADQIRCIRFDTEDRTLREVASESLCDVLNEPHAFVWIDIQGPNVATLNALLRELGTEMSVGHHFDYPAVLPRVFEHPSCLVCYVYEVGDPDRHLHIVNGLGRMVPSRIILVLSEKFVVTYHREAMPCLDYVHSRSRAVFCTEGQGPCLIAYLLFQRCMYEYAHLNLANDNYLDQLHSGLSSDDYDASIGIIELAHGNILTLKKMISSLQIVLGRLTTMQTPFIDAEFRARVLQLHKNAFPVRWALDSSRQFIDGILAGMQTASSNRMSEIATVLTIISAIILPLTLITGIYGMNFDDIPEIHIPGGYYICLAIMIGIVVGQLWLFRRLGWLRSITRAVRRITHAGQTKPAGSPPAAAGHALADTAAPNDHDYARRSFTASESIR